MRSSTSRRRRSHRRIRFSTRAATIAVLVAGQGGVYLPAVEYTVSGAYEIAPGDLNGDGKLDLVVTSQSFNVEQQLVEHRLMLVLFDDLRVATLPVGGVLRPPRLDAYR